ncbi:BCCT family transporter [Litorimonas sp. WD9-15]|uniref:BCCT family transporter n=1 Tax=Litorimonas sp. WD9-15 TaxID=3418716 RepID=UPI003D089579
MSQGPIRHIVFWLPLTLFTTLVVTSLIMPVKFLRAATALNNLILDIFSQAFSLAAFAFVLTCLWAAVSPLGKIRIGGHDAVPLLTRWNWMAITLTTTVAIGILFWATAEPLYHLYTPGGLPIEPNSAEAARFSMASLYLHWSFTPYAIYTIPGLTFALCYYNLKKPFSLSAPISVLINRPVPRIGADLLDSLALIALLFGLSASLGAGIMSISGGIDRLSPLSVNPVLTGFVALTIISAFFMSSASGLQRGIRVLSDINTKIFIALMIFVLIAGPTLEILSLGRQSLVTYAKEFIPRSLMLEPHNDEPWLKSWTVFYFANWMAWAPLAALFLGKISRGYTVREYILVNLFLPAMFSILWMTIFGGLAINIELAKPQILNDVLENLGPEHVLYAVLDTLPLATGLALLVVTVSFLSYVTAADSSLDVIATLTRRKTTAVELKTDMTAGPKARKTSLILKFIWALAVGFAAWMMTTLSGIDGVKMLSNLGGLPALFIIVIFNITLIVLGTVKLKALRV